MYYLSLSFSFISFSKIGKGLLIKTIKRASASFLDLSDTLYRDVPFIKWFRLYTQMQTLLAK